MPVAAASGTGWEWWISELSLCPPSDPNHGLTARDDFGDFGEGPAPKVRDPRRVRKMGLTAAVTLSPVTRPGE
jgi:hypothetical protein